MLPSRFFRLSVLLFCISATTTLAQAQLLPTLNNTNPVASTVPANGDLNPYGVAQVPKTQGKLTQGNILVSNFNNSANQQGTGSTIVQISPTGAVQLFAQINAKKLPGSCPGGVGLTTALVALESGFVVVGSLPTSDGTSATIKAGCLIILDDEGNVVETISGGKIAGPWDMTAADGAETATLFVTNVLNSPDLNSTTPSPTATVVRVVLRVDVDIPQVMDTTVVGSGFPVRFDPAALIIGPTGVALDGNQDLLFVADSLNNRIAGIPNPMTITSSAGTGVTLSKGGALNDPLAMSRVPNTGNIIISNGGDGNLVEITDDGLQVAKKLVDSSGSPPGAGALFGLLALNDRVFFVDDATNTLNVAEAGSQ